MNRYEPCRHGHLLCATVYGGPCADETFQNKAAEIAQSFQDKLSYWLGVDQLQEMRNRNASELNPYVCHSHDYVDANETMAEAFDDCGADCDDEELWNMAWHLSAEFLGR